VAKLERRQICLDADDLSAGVQILAYIARPHRPDSVAKIFDAWVNQTEKPSRLRPKIATTVKDLLNGFEAARWLQRAILSGGANNKEVFLLDSWQRVPVTGFPGSWPATSLRSNASSRAAEVEGIGNAFRDIWSKRKPILHLALAAGSEIGRLHHSQLIKGLDINLVVTDLSWVKPALAQAEGWAASAQTLSILPPALSWHFLQRDSF
jgi:hypothetical protein